MQISPLLILGLQIAPLMTGLKLTCVRRLQARSNSKNALPALGTAGRWHPGSRAAHSASLPASVCLARFLRDASAQDIFKYTQNFGV